MSSILIVKDNTFTVLMDTTSWGGFPMKRWSEEGFYTQVGFYIPIANSGFSAVDILEGRDHEDLLKPVLHHGVLITHEGLVYHYMVGNREKPIESVRIPVAPGFRAIYVMPEELGAVVNSALEVNDWDITPALDLIDKAVFVRRQSFQTFELEKIVEELKERGLTNPINFYEPRRTRPFRQPVIAEGGDVEDGETRRRHIPGYVCPPGDIHPRREQ